MVVVLFLVLSYPFTRSQTGAFSLSGDSSKNMELFVRPFRVTTTRGGRKWKIFQKPLLPSCSRFPSCFHARLKVASGNPLFFVTLGKNDTLNSEKWTKEEEGNRLQKNTLVGVGARCSTRLRETNVSEIRGNSAECNEICRHVSRIKMSSLFPFPRRPVPPSSIYDVASPCVALRSVSFLGTSR